MFVRVEGCERRLDLGLTVREVRMEGKSMKTCEELAEADVITIAPAIVIGGVVVGCWRVDVA